MRDKRLPVVSDAPVAPDILPGLRVALELVVGRKKLLSSKLSQLELTQELDRIAAMIRLEMEFAAKVGKPLKKS